MVLSPCLMSLTCLNDLAIVVVEDHDDARRYLELFLGQLGAKVVVASNAFEGLRAIKNTLPDLVLSDIKMPCWMGANCWKIFVPWDRMPEAMYRL